MEKKNAFICICEYLWGDNWKSLASIYLDVNRRTISRWVNGDNEIPENIFHDLKNIFMEKDALRCDIILLFQKILNPK